MPSHCDHHHSTRTPQSIAFAGEHPRATSVRDDRPGAVWSLEPGQSCERNHGWNLWFSDVFCLELPLEESAGQSTKQMISKYLESIFVNMLTNIWNWLKLNMLMKRTDGKLGLALPAYRTSACSSQGSASTHALRRSECVEIPSPRSRRASPKRF